MGHGKRPGVSRGQRILVYAGFMLVYGGKSPSKQTQVIQVTQVNPPKPGRGPWPQSTALPRCQVHPRRSDDPNRSHDHRTWPGRIAWTFFMGAAPQKNATRMAKTMVFVCVFGVIYIGGLMVP